MPPGQRVTSTMVLFQLQSGYGGNNDCFIHLLSYILCLFLIQSLKLGFALRELLRELRELWIIMHGQLRVVLVCDPSCACTSEHFCEDPCRIGCMFCKKGGIHLKFLLTNKMMTVGGRQHKC